MRDSLKPAYRPAELHPVLGILYRHLQHRLRAADHFDALADSSTAQRSVHDLPTMIRPTHHVIPGKLHVMDRNLSLLVRRDGLKDVALYACTPGVNQE